MSTCTVMKKDDTKISSENHDVVLEVDFVDDNNLELQVVEDQNVAVNFQLPVCEENNERRSQRQKQMKRSYTPASSIERDKNDHRKRKKFTSKKVSTARTERSNLCDKAPNGEPFCCAWCKSVHIVNPSRRMIAQGGRRSRHNPSPRYKMDEKTGKYLILCNACGLMFDRKEKNRKIKSRPAEEDRLQYIENGKSFAASFVEILSDPDAAILFCPNFNTRPCGCIQKFISGEEVGVEGMNERAKQLLNLLKKAKYLSEEKYCLTYDAKRKVSVGLGNGQKRSKNFEEFVLTNRIMLKQELKFCERATQKLLKYSNNFLHKPLKTEQASVRVQRVKGKAALGLLIPIPDLVNKTCCQSNCVRMAATHSTLLENWRKAAMTSQKEARKVLAEMLTPCGGVVTNCSYFISFVTGCSFSTIANVRDQMIKTGGIRDPPEHGLKRYWQNLNKKNQTVAASKAAKQAKNVVTESLPSLDDSARIADFAVSVNADENSQDLGSYRLVPNAQLIDLQQQIQLQQQQIQQQQQLLQDSFHLLLHPTSQTSNVMSSNVNPLDTLKAISEMTESRAGDGIKTYSQVTDGKTTSHLEEPETIIHLDGSRIVHINSDALSGMQCAAPTAKQSEVTILTDNEDNAFLNQSLLPPTPQEAPATSGNLTNVSHDKVILLGSGLNFGVPSLNNTSPVKRTNFAKHSDLKGMTFQLSNPQTKDTSLVSKNQEPPLKPSMSENQDTLIQLPVVGNPQSTVQVPLTVYQEPQIQFSDTENENIPIQTPVLKNTKFHLPETTNQELPIEQLNTATQTLVSKTNDQHFQLSVMENNDHLDMSGNGKNPTQLSIKRQRQPQLLVTGHQELPKQLSVTGNRNTHMQTTVTESNSQTELSFTVNNEHPTYLPFTGSRTSSFQLPLTEMKEPATQLLVTENKGTSTKLPVTGNRETPAQLSVTRNKETPAQLSVPGDKETPTELPVTENRETSTQLSITGNTRPPTTHPSPAENKERIINKYAKIAPKFLNLQQVLTRIPPGTTVQNVNLGTRGTLLHVGANMSPISTPVTTTMMFSNCPTTMVPQTLATSVSSTPQLSTTSSIKRL